MLRNSCGAAVLALLACGAGPARADDPPARLRVIVPPAAVLSVDGQPTHAGGEVRLFESPKLAPGQTFQYHLQATWVAGEKLAVAEATVHLRAGHETIVDLRQPTSYREMVATGQPALAHPPVITPKPAPVAALPMPTPRQPRPVARTLYPVTGRLLIDGRQGVRAILTFHPANPANPARPTATVRENGTFTVTTPQAAGQAAAGAPAGDYTVTVVWPKGSGNAVNMLPTRYAQPATSPLKVTVRPGQNNLQTLEIKTP